MLNNFWGDCLEKLKRFSGRGPKIDCLLKKGVFTTFTDAFRSVIGKHAHLKTKMIRGIKTPFMTKALSKALMTRLTLKSKFNKWQSR